ncbi:MAG: hypothetical protein Q9174_007464, partial [Haloplaca sp. 1 TL-2023]
MAESTQQPMVSSSSDDASTAEARYAANNIENMMLELTRNIVPPLPTFIYKILVRHDEIGDLSRDPLVLQRNCFDVVNGHFETFLASKIE